MWTGLLDWSEKTVPTGRNAERKLGGSEGDAVYSAARDAAAATFVIALPLSWKIVPVTATSLL